MQGKRNEAAQFALHAFFLSITILSTQTLTQNLSHASLWVFVSPRCSQRQRERALVITLTFVHNITKADIDNASLDAENSVNFPVESGLGGSNALRKKQTLLEGKPIELFSEKERIRLFGEG